MFLNITKLYTIEIQDDTKLKFYKILKTTAQDVPLLFWIFVSKT